MVNLNSSLWGRRIFEVGKGATRHGIHNPGGVSPIPKEHLPPRSHTSSSAGVKGELAYTPVLRGRECYIACEES